MAFLVNENGKQINMATYLGLKAKDYYAKSNSGTIPELKKEKFKELADLLQEYSDSLTAEAVEANTAMFDKVRADLNTRNTEIKNKLDSLEHTADVLQNIATVLTIVDQALAIAAGVMA